MSKKLKFRLVVEYEIEKDGEKAGYGTLVGERRFAKQTYGKSAKVKVERVKD